MLIPVPMWYVKHPIPSPTLVRAIYLGFFHFIQFFLYKHKWLLVSFRFLLELVHHGKIEACPSYFFCLFALQASFFGEFIDIS